MNAPIFTPGWSRERRRELRQKMTEAESLLWDRLRDKQFYGWKFQKQHGIGPYVVDFFCHQLHLVVEVNGQKEHHEDDATREAYLASFRLRIFHCTNEEVIASPEHVLERLTKFISGSPVLPLPSPGDG